MKLGKATATPRGTVQTTTRSTAAPGASLNELASVHELTVDQIRAIRAELITTLKRKIDGVPVAGTVRWIAAELGSSSARAIALTSSLLADLKREGLVTTRKLRSGEELWKVTDQHHAAWQAQSFAIAAPRARS